MHEDIISHAGIHQGDQQERDKEGGESSRNEGRQARRKVVEETSSRRWLRKDPKEGEIEKTVFFQEERPCKDLKEKLLSVTITLNAT